MESESGERPLIGKSEALAGVLRLVRKAGPSSATVLLLGETGTGKDWWPRPSRG